MNVTSYTPKEDGGPAFPVPFVQDGDPVGLKNADGQRGMSLRDVFAGQALVGLLSGNPDSDCGCAGYAHDAYMYADAMLKARDERKNDYS